MNIFKLNDPIFKDIQVLESEYVPEKIISRDKQINDIAFLLNPALLRNHPQSGVIYGKTGTGKTAIVKYVCLELEKLVKEKGLNVDVVFINCKETKATSKLVVKIINKIAPHYSVPFAGLAISEYYQKLWDALNEKQCTLIVILDEIDKLRDKDILYHLTRANENMNVKNIYIGIIGISNDLNFINTIDQRTYSSFSHTSIVFPPYNGEQLIQILEDRATLAFNDGALDNGVIELCASLSAQEHGDARKALTLLKNSGRYALSEGSEKVSIDHVYSVRDNKAMNCIAETITTLPLHPKLTLATIIKLATLHEEQTYTREVYDSYVSLCKDSGITPLTLDTISGFIAELDMLGIISASVVSKGRHGRTRQITIPINPQIYISLFEENISTMEDMVDMISSLDKLIMTPNPKSLLRRI